DKRREGTQEAQEAQEGPKPSPSCASCASCVPSTVLEHVLQRELQDPPIARALQPPKHVAGQSSAGIDEVRGVENVGRVRTKFHSLGLFDGERPRQAGVYVEVPWTTHHAGMHVSDSAWIGSGECCPIDPEARWIRSDQVIGALVSVNIARELIG